METADRSSHYTSYHW